MGHPAPPACQQVGESCGGPGQRTLSCCGDAQCIKNPGSGKMRCEALLGGQLETLDAHNITLLTACPGCRQCASAGARCGDDLSCCDGMRCEGLLGGTGKECVDVHPAPPACQQVGESCGGPGQLTLSCCGYAQCITNPGNGKMRCEAFLGGQAETLDAHNTTLLTACPGCRQCASAGARCGDDLPCCDGMRCEALLGGTGKQC